ncbi:LysR family transcriptional regulator [Beijerinckiaceae bacterium RH AL1]|nr:LysR family transcriptional regulator [Beijerinckiaceae bacterium]VVB47483.1 LysR family transcriptional regulator [Beijerinckiaceae bacterium RH CH11]VVB47564.1 LysR family transcriptional regulator [Beijerinckiaceae bacterium RH AL8]VVC55911.1 LysR family transcriptional regulator [Beijerinckiaceae bacterium RH AL1]
MATDVRDLQAFLAVARAGGFRGGALKAGASASALSEAVRRLERQLGVRLLNRTTRSVSPTEVGARLIERLTPALAEVESALDVVNLYRERPAGTLRLNVPTAVSKLVLPSIVPGFLASYPEIKLEVLAEESFVDLIAAGCDAGVRYDERLEQDMVAIPIGPRVQRFALGAAPAYLDRRGRPAHPRDLLGHDCLCGRFPSGANVVWELQRGEEIVRIEPQGPLLVSLGTATDLAVEAAVAGVGVVALFEDWLRPFFESAALEPVLEQWWQPFPGPFLYYPGRRLVPAPLRAFIDYVRALPAR